MNKPSIRNSLLALLLLLPLSVSAIPQTLSYQGTLTDLAGAPLNGAQSITFNLYNVSSSGTTLWTETQGTVMVTQGLFTVELGNGTPFPLNLFAAPLWLGVSVNADAEMSPRTPLSSEGYAFKAEDADRLEGMSAATLDQSAHAANTTGNPHSVTTTLIGAVDTTTFSGHTNNTGNPHNVTSTQTGAVDTATFGTHTGDSTAHHAPYTNLQAITAMGIKTDPNPLNHDKYTNLAAVAAILAADGAGTTLDADLVDGMEASELIDAAQDEVRIPITTLPFTISQPGSYYLVSNLTATTGGINVFTDNVTIDLMGFTLFGNGVNVNGINLTFRSAVTIKNGKVRGFGRAGIINNSSTSRYNQVFDVQALANGTLGTSGAYSGIYLAGTNNHIERCTAGDNGGSGFYGGLSSNVVGNTAYNNQGTYGIYGHIGSTLTGNTAYSNQGTYGIFGHAGSTLTGNTAYSNQSWGIWGNGNNTIKDNTIYFNNLSNTANRGGLRVVNNSQVRGNTLNGNRLNNIYVASTDNAIEDNLVTDSTGNGINFFTTSGNYWNNNRASGNATNYVNGAGQNSDPGNVSF